MTYQTEIGINRKDATCNQEILRDGYTILELKEHHAIKRHHIYTLGKG